ncbi:hypothetical protein Agub_g7877, partial [Astrephomene gubernaculifera]
ISMRGPLPVKASRAAYSGSSSKSSNKTDNSRGRDAPPRGQPKSTRRAHDNANKAPPRGSGRAPTKPSKPLIKPAANADVEDDDLDYEGAEGDDGSPPIDLDALLADESAVRQLRSSLLSSLSAQHADAAREEADLREVPSLTPQQPLQPVNSSTNAIHGSGTKKLSSAAPAAVDSNAVTESRQKPDSDSGTRKSNTHKPPPQQQEAPQHQLPIVVLKKDKARLFSYGNPMVYGGAVDCVIGRPPPGAGDTVVVVDHSRRPLGWGVFNPHSMFRVRLLQLQSEMEAAAEEEAHATDAAVPSAAATAAASGAVHDPYDVPSLVDRRIRQAVALRQSLGLPSQQTNVFRLVNSEGDRLSGLVVDVLGRVAVLQAGAAWVMRYRAAIESSLLSACAAWGVSQLVWRPQWRVLQQEGLTEGGEQEGQLARAEDGSEDDGAEAGEGGEEEEQEKEA